MDVYLVQDTSLVIQGPCYLRITVMVAYRTAVILLHDNYHSTWYRIFR